ncbi:MAG: bifunctional diaminohydroxyphosphoribosylaminopyrimidine deaminase/5-amino-6-(5-phosphoribosylamino)uracil reductase RibD [Gammaproteobacteria bacterium]|nr:bifunctional diaminohydroxyphosphoribosylaminopyrimidine deaminase/5-amino-6-(5-phosphoribosylamino)uracil reductase RibD [Gammaproteobacteria bacterium]MCH9763178.1 bifunctional diaminohydroxyphosphoribosylaminopyrimidine deaminase/5-amino-6-(5-phosphoribosylamino)uracil reductase RibD [Gammaproteobacteria bacterium]
MHEPFMLAALQQAWLGRGVTAPNPAVGAVAVSDEKIIAQASHPGMGQPHAEQLLLKELPDDCSEITLYVTLEPCNHWGRTPPCTQGIIARGFKQVVYAYADPNPLVSKNDTTALLAEQGIDVVHYPLDEVDAFYASYAFWLQTGRPWVTLKIAQSFDGKIAGKHGQRVQLSNDLCSKNTHKERFYTDVILTTARTIEQDNPLLNARINGRITHKPIAVLDNKKQLSIEANVHKTAKKIHMYCDQSLFDILLDLGRLGYHDVWVEAGSQLFNALHKEKLVQRTVLYLVPTSLGKDALALYHDVDLFTDAKKIQWDVLDDNLKVTVDWI